ncbi:hypothetical protein AUJ17_00805 [Candidatus Micrarchaeota archaeon CG1_02_47_40]|nr:MAG: hypothetical protein AUJ17_00805 [Candidatus Micrarchaeota archaeon CG1_02_47_40]
MPGKKILWALMAGMITFDNIYSYIAVVYYGLREANPIPAFFVSITPLYYFASILLSLLFLYLLVKVLCRWGVKGEKTKKEEKQEALEMLAMTCVAIAWGIGITSFNLASFLNGFFPPRMDWRLVSFAGAALALMYALYEGNRLKKRFSWDAK